jgi:hypothetical protein
MWPGRSRGGWRGARARHLRTRSPQRNIDQTVRAISMRFPSYCRRNELRQAATWGLGKTSCRAYVELVDLLSDEDDAVALHAIAAFGSAL